MKDATHHLKHLQRKVIQSTKKASNNEAVLNGSSNNNSKKNQVEVPVSKPVNEPMQKKRARDNQLGKDFVRMNVH